MADFKLAWNAGHYKGTAGKRVMKALDPAETREWVLHNRVADRVEQLLQQNYTGYQLLRIDDTTGETDIPLQKRTDTANQWKADLYLSIHHNAGINGGKGALDLHSMGLWNGDACMNDHRIEYRSFGHRSHCICSISSLLILSLHSILCVSDTM